jgi:hypothetical protein
MDPRSQVIYNGYLICTLIYVQPLYLRRSRQDTGTQKGHCRRKPHRHEETLTLSKIFGDVRISGEAVLPKIVHSSAKEERGLGLAAESILDCHERTERGLALRRDKNWET